MQINHNMGWNEIKGSFLINDKAGWNISFLSAFRLPALPPAPSRARGADWHGVAAQPSPSPPPPARKPRSAPESQVHPICYSHSPGASEKPGVDRCTGNLKWQFWPPEVRSLQQNLVQPPGEMSGAPYGAGKINNKMKIAVAAGSRNLKKKRKKKEKKKKEDQKKKFKDEEREVIN